MHIPRPNIPVMLVAAVACHELMSTSNEVAPENISVMLTTAPTCVVQVVPARCLLLSYARANKDRQRKQSPRPHTLPDNMPAYVDAHTDMGTHTRTDIHGHTDTRTHGHTDTRTHVYTHTHTRARAHTHEQTHRRVHRQRCSTTWHHTMTAASESLTRQRAMSALKKRAPQTRSVEADLPKQPGNRTVPISAAKPVPTWRISSHMALPAHAHAHSEGGETRETCASERIQVDPPRVEETIHPRDTGCVPFPNGPMRRLTACGVPHVP